MIYIAIKICTSVSLNKNRLKIYLHRVLTWLESCRCIDSQASAICLYIKIDMRLKFDGTESKAVGVQKEF